MTKKTNLAQIYSSHSGYSSDKWNIYLNVYNRLFSKFKRNRLRLLEVGVQNGGSLEIWAKYFHRAEIIVGCDINEKCRSLNYNDDRIKLIIGNINNQETIQQLKNHSLNYNIIIDDGSHTSSDIIASFLNLFPLLQKDGLYIIEDLHCSYWKDFDGGLFYPSSSMNFLKALTDILNFEHWGIAQNRSEYLAEFLGDRADKYENILSEIHSVEFINSMCIISKRSANENLLGVRHVVGDSQPIASNKHAHGTHIGTRPQEPQCPPARKDATKSEQQYIDYLLARINELESTLNLPPQQS